MSGRSLASYGPLLIAANVRGALEVDALHVKPGRGHPGDLVVGTITPPPGGEMTILDGSRGSHRIDTSVVAVAPLGSRDSSTHVCATIPPQGLEVQDGTHAHWVAGESGIVGCLEREPSPSAIHRPETALPFRCAGLVADQEGVLNIERFAVRPALSRGTLPIVMVAATSSEAGKTVLGGELVRRLSHAGLRVAALKVTGTGGVMDSMHHAACGAAVTLDQVDAGLITTHGDAAAVRERIPLLFLRAEELGADVILAELGGDLVSANNPVLFEIPELAGRTRFVVVIANDALSAAGVSAINASRLRVPVSRLRFFSSPFRNHAGMARRMAAVGIARVLDPRSSDDLDLMASEVATFATGTITPPAPQPTPAREEASA